MAEAIPNSDQSSHLIRIPFLETPHYRDTGTSKDLRFVNGYFEPIKNQIKSTLYYFFTKRPGLSQNIQPSGGAAVGRGVYVWKGDIYSVFGTQIYKNTVNLGVTLTTATGRCNFMETRPGAAIPYLAVNDGIKLYCINVTGTVTTVTTNFPTPNTRDLEYMDGYLFTLDANCNLWNCNFDDPTTWSTTQFITSQMMPGMGVGLARCQNLIVVLSDRHQQGFYDNANASGSPLNNADQYMHKIGCGSADTIAHEEDMVFWVGNGYLGGYTVWAMLGSNQPQDVGVNPVNRVINAEGMNLSNARGFVFRCAGRILYVLTLFSANRTFVYDPDINYWCEWTDTSGSNSWPIVQTAEYKDSVLAQHTTNGWIYTLSPSTYQDDSVSFPVIARSPRQDFDTLKRKFVHRVDIVGDRPTSTANATIQYSDDDYQTFSTARTFDLSLTRAFGLSWGNFRRRSWQLTYTGNQPLRLVGLELDVTVED